MIALSWNNDSTIRDEVLREIAKANSNGQLEYFFANYDAEQLYKFALDSGLHPSFVFLANKLALSQDPSSQQTAIVNILKSVPVGSDSRLQVWNWVEWCWSSAPGSILESLNGTLLESSAREIQSLINSSFRDELSPAHLWRSLRRELALNVSVPDSLLAYKALLMNYTWNIQDNPGAVDDIFEGWRQVSLKSASCFYGWTSEKELYFSTLFSELTQKALDRVAQSGATSQQEKRSKFFEYRDEVWNASGNSELLEISNQINRKGRALFQQWCESAYLAITTNSVA